MAFSIPKNGNSSSCCGGTAAANAAPTETSNMRLVKDNTGRFAAEHDLLLKGIVIGDSGVGKSSLLYRFADNDWNPHYIATIGVDFRSLTFDRAGKTLKLQIWDTAGQERFKTITRTFYRGVHGVMLVFDVTDAETFDHIREWVKEATQFGQADLPFLLVGNKADLAASSRQVPSEAGQQLARQLNCEYIEASAKSDSNVAAAFARLAETCMERKLKLAAANPSNPMRNPTKRIALNEELANPKTESAKCAC